MVDMENIPILTKKNPPPRKEVLQGLQIIAVFCAKLLAVKAPAWRSVDVLACIKYLNEPGFLINIYQHEDVPGHRICMIEAPKLGIGRMWARRFVFAAGHDGDFAHIAAHIDGADMQFVAGAK
jgi:hypothetical protein